jgi:hypothetical protein
MEQFALNLEARLTVADAVVSRFTAAVAMEAGLTVNRIDDVVLAMTTVVAMARERRAQSLAVTCAASERQLDVVVSALAAHGAAVPLGDGPAVDGMPVLRMLADNVDGAAAQGGSPTLRLRFTSDETFMTL